MSATMLHPLRHALLVLVAAISLVSTAASAQSQAELVSAFSGDWQVFDPALASGDSPCRLSLASLTNDRDRMTLTGSGCAPPLSAARAWSIEGAQLVLYDDEGKQLIRLGGNQRRINGTTDAGLPVILERSGGDGTAALLQAAFNASGCYYLGYSQTCAPRTELGVPAAEPDGRVRISLEANITAYSEPRADAPAIGAVQQKSCLVVEGCTMASDGPWCRARFGENLGWIRKLTLRQNRWPVVTYTNGCTP